MLLVRIFSLRKFLLKVFLHFYFKFRKSFLKTQIYYKSFWKNDQN